MSIPAAGNAADWGVPIKMETDSDIVIKEEPLFYESDPDDEENRRRYEDMNVRQFSVPGEYEVF